MVANLQAELARTRCDSPFAAARRRPIPPTIAGLHLRAAEKAGTYSARSSRIQRDNCAYRRRRGAGGSAPATARPLLRLVCAVPARPGAQPALTMKVAIAAAVAHGPHVIEATRLRPKWKKFKFLKACSSDLEQQGPRYRKDAVAVERVTIAGGCRSHQALAGCDVLDRFHRPEARLLT